MNVVSAYGLKTGSLPLLFEGRTFIRKVNTPAARTDLRKPVRLWMADETGWAKWGM